ncbi:uncharacterized protein EV420DRAFT_425964 [Desarmillaria tabescens]|uniref:PARP catalytic domain-containing protein n=1 Tax=Armillaria tabescens TaxID=1929756 RepID=A0AA39T6G9_ARMTA|nr:uncharacterized protein EV420DRAFT_425964 [Desarmillaria tabescens]KAK0467741.1 hypothetical protein EV420DRAFT_425964 [Desarmillaria tabescens]
MANKICLVCKKRPKRDKYQFCSKRCTDTAANRAPQLLRVPKDHVMYKDVATSFGQNWNWQRGPRPSIARIYLITWSPSLRKSFDDYRENIARTMKGNKEPKEVKRFRCEARKCRLGDPGELNNKLCGTPDCWLCRAIETGFRTTLDNKRLGRGLSRGSRFGRGIYMAPSSSMAFQYAENGGSGSKYKAVLTTRVVLGNPQTVKLDNWGRLEPDKGYDSVEAHPPVGPTEVVVFHHDAARPAYLIIAKQ